jgi:hypothetical protein
LPAQQSPRLWSLPADVQAPRLGAAAMTGPTLWVATSGIPAIPVPTPHAGTTGCWPPRPNAGRGRASSSNGAGRTPTTGRPVWSMSPTRETPAPSKCCSPKACSDPWSHRAVQGSTGRLDGGAGHGQVYYESDFRERIKAVQRMRHTETTGPARHSATPPAASAQPAPNSGPGRPSTANPPNAWHHSWHKIADTHGESRVRCGRPCYHNRR